MSARSATLRARRRAEALMIDQCEIRGAGSYSGPIDPETGEREYVPGPLRYQGPCKVQTYEPHESTPDSGQHLYSVQRYSLHIPVGAGPVNVNDEVTIASMELDPNGVDRAMRIAGLLHKSFASAQRLLLDELPPTE